MISVSRERRVDTLSDSLKRLLSYVMNPSIESASDLLSYTES